MTGPERDALILSLEKTVKGIAYKRALDLPRMIQIDELISAAWVGAIEAVDRYDPARNVPLELYARQRISGAIGDYLRTIDPVTRDHRQHLKANPDLPPPITFSIKAQHGHDEPRSFEFIDRHSLADVRRIEATLDVRKIIRRAGAKPRSISIITRHAAGEKMKAIGVTEGIKESRVSQICKATLTKLRAAA